MNASPDRGVSSQFEGFGPSSVHSEFKLSIRVTWPTKRFRRQLEGSWVCCIDPSKWGIRQRARKYIVHGFSYFFKQFAWLFIRRGIYSKLCKYRFFFAKAAKYSSVSWTNECKQFHFILWRFSKFTVGLGDVVKLKLTYLLRLLYFSYVFETTVRSDFYFLFKGKLSLTVVFGFKNSVPTRQGQEVEQEQNQMDEK